MSTSRATTLPTHPLQLTHQLSAARARAGAVRRLALARLISLAGTDASGVAFSFGLYAQTRSTLWLAAGMLVTFGLGSVLAPLGGALADRLPRKRLMVGAELVSAASMASLALWHTPPAMLGVSLVSTAAGLVFGPAANAAIPSVAGEDGLARANAHIATGGNVGKTAGRLGGGLLVGLLGFPVVLALDAVSFLVSAALILTVLGDFEAEREPDGPRPRVPAWRSWTLPLEHPILRPLVICSCVATFATSFSMTAETVLVFHFHAGGIGLGALASCWALGMIAGSWFSGRALDAHNEASGLFLGRVVMGVALGCVGLAPVFWPALICYAAGGAAGGFLMVAAQSLMHRHTDDASR
ncbi:MAG: putative rane protein, partial [Solirubrobacterales bacterium]|nr:putative rane protein [Solirubrobacterales bacterium]